MNDTQPAERLHQLVEDTTFGDLPRKRHVCTVCGTESVGSLPELPCPGRRDVPAPSPAQEPVRDVAAVVAEVSALEAAATPGPWAVYEHVTGCVYAVEPPTEEVARREATLANENEGVSWESHVALPRPVAELMRNAFAHGRMRGVESMRVEVERLEGLLEAGGEQWSHMAAEHEAVCGKALAMDDWRTRAEAAEAALAEERAKVARVEALAEEWRRMTAAMALPGDRELVEAAVASLDVALAGPDPADTTQPAEREGVKCRHCGSPPEDDGDHSCPCPNPDGECPQHDPKPRTSVAEAIAAWEAKGPTSLTVALLSDALYGVQERAAEADGQGREGGR